MELRQRETLVERVDEVYFDSLSDVLERPLDDGQWRRIKVDILSNPASVHKQKAQA